MKLRLEKREDRTPNVTTFWFTPDEPTEWQAGQSIRLEVPCGFSSDERRFTISSAPHEQHIAITTRQSESDFKQALFALELGAEVDGYAIEGSFTWQESETPHLFVAGGIGITPFWAMLKNRAHKQLPVNAHLLYLNKDDLLAEELKELAQQQHEFSVTFLEREELKQAIESYLQLQPAALSYFSGPPLLVREAARVAYQLQGTMDTIKVDHFTGYRSLL